MRGLLVVTGLLMAMVALTAAGGGLLPRGAGPVPASVSGSR